MNMGLPGPGEVQVGCVAEAVAVPISANTAMARRILTDALVSVRFGARAGSIAVQTSVASVNWLVFGLSTTHSSFGSGTSP